MNEFKGFLKSFVYAANGLKYCIKNERNLRFHLTFLIYMFSILRFGGWFTLTRTDYAVLIGICALVVSLEIVNSAVENSVNLAREEYTEYGKIAKDAGAGAVLMAAVFAVIVGFVILFQPEAFKLMYEYYKENIGMLLILLVSLIPAVLFVLKGFPSFKGK